MSRLPFELRLPGRILFGRGVFTRTAECAHAMGRRALVVTGASALRPHEPIPDPAEQGPSRKADREKDSSRTEERDEGAPGRAITRRSDNSVRSGSLFSAAADSLRSHDVGVVHFLVRGEPTTQTADEGARLALASGCDLVVGLGGGSVLDAAKAISGLMTNGGEALDYLEVVGRGKSLEHPAAPFLAVPTTSGTGSEATKNAVLTDPRSRVKASMRSAYLLPAAAIVDPLLTHSLPPRLTASTGLDALTQLIEAYLTPRANDITDSVALAGIELSARSLLTAVGDGTSEAAREDLSIASLFGGLALAGAGLGAVHGIAAPLGGRFSIPHGSACAILLPHVLETNLRALRSRDAAGPGLRRLDRVGEILIRSYRLPDGSTAEDRAEEDLADTAVRLVRDLVSRCHPGGLGAYGVTSSDLPDLADASQRASSMQGNPITLSQEEIESAIAAAL